MNVEPWQLCILVTTGIVLAEFAVNALLRRKDSIALRKRVRTVALSLLAVLTIVVGVVALGPSLADQLASVAAAVTAVVAVWLAYRSYQAPPSHDGGGTGAPDIPATRQGLDSEVDASTSRERDDTATSS
jgi:hypothetical protein